MGNLSYRLGRWVRGSALFCAFKGPLKVEDWATKCAKITTPDELVAAAIIQSFAKDFHKWKITGKFSTTWDGYSSYNQDGEAKPILTNDEKKLTVAFHLTQHRSRQFSMNLWEERDQQLKSCRVNDVSIGIREARQILNAWYKITANIKAAKEAAARAKREMEENEKKWNLAEQLLGMRRTHTGALVPKDHPGCMKSCCVTKEKGL